MLRTTDMMHYGVRNLIAGVETEFDSEVERRLYTRDVLQALVQERNMQQDRWDEQQQLLITTHER